MSKSLNILSVAAAFLLAVPFAFSNAANAACSDRALNANDHAEHAKAAYPHCEEKHAFFHHAFAHGFPMNDHGCYYGTPFPFSLGSKIEVKGGHYLQCVASKQGPISQENPLHWESVKGFLTK